MGDLWEFPGGKKELQESIEITIAREIREELGIDIEVGKELISFYHSYSDRKLHFIVHLCKLNAGKPLPLSSQQIKWANIDDLNSYPFPAANLTIIRVLKEYLVFNKS